MSVTVKSDDPTAIGQHAFQRRGLGMAPFRVVGFERRWVKVAPDDPGRPGGSCDYCGTGIADCCLIRSADGKTFVVGTTCVDKTGDAGLIRAYKKSAPYRAHQRELRQAKDARVVEEWNALMANEVIRETLAARIVPTYDGKGTESWLAFAERAWGWCGMAGHARYLRAAKQILAVASRTPGPA